MKWFNNRKHSNLCKVINIWMRCAVKADNRVFWVLNVYLLNPIFEKEHGNYVPKLKCIHAKLKMCDILVKLDCGL